MEKQKPPIDRATSPLRAGERSWLPANSWVDWPFGNLAIPEGPMALRPTFADGLPLSRNPAAPLLFASRFIGGGELLLALHHIPMEKEWDMKDALSKKLGVFS